MSTKWQESRGIGIGQTAEYCLGVRQNNGVMFVQVSSVNSARPQRPVLYYYLIPLSTFMCCIQLKNEKNWKLRKKYRAKAARSQVDYVFRLFTLRKKLTKTPTYIYFGY